MFPRDPRGKIDRAYLAFMMNNIWIGSLSSKLFLLGGLLIFYLGFSFWDKLCYSIG